MIQNFIILIIISPLSMVGKIKLLWLKNLKLYQILFLIDFHPMKSIQRIILTFY